MNHPWHLIPDRRSPTSGRRLPIRCRLPSGARGGLFSPSPPDPKRGLLCTITDPNGHITRFGYDATRRPQTETDPLGHVTTTAYDVAGNPHDRDRSPWMPSTSFWE
jgi:YD repeat-containing protein